MKYSIDTSAILEGWTRLYPPDVAPGLWEKLEELVAAGELIATEEVLVELKKKEDDAAYKWAQRQRAMFKPIDANIQQAVAIILKNHTRLIEANRNRSSADPFVIGLAQVESCKVVTAERPSGSLNKPKIPDVCSALKVPWISLMELCREQKLVLVAKG